jgi:hypothetical protein
MNATLLNLPSLSILLGREGVRIDAVHAIEKNLFR